MGAPAMQSRNKRRNFDIGGKAIRRQDFEHFRDMLDGSAKLCARVLAAGGHA